MRPRLDGIALCEGKELLWSVLRYQSGCRPEGMGKSFGTGCVDWVSTSHVTFTSVTLPILKSRGIALGCVLHVTARCQDIQLNKHRNDLSGRAEWKDGDDYRLVHHSLPTCTNLHGLTLDGASTQLTSKSPLSLILSGCNYLLPQLGP